VTPGRFSPLSIIPTMLHTHIYLHVSLIGRTHGRSLGNLQNQSSFGNRGSLVREVLSLFSCGYWEDKLYGDNVER
jgi:hypothetical protein